MNSSTYPTVIFSGNIITPRRILSDQLTLRLHQRVDALAVGFHLGVAEYQRHPVFVDDPDDAFFSILFFDFVIWQMHDFAVSNVSFTVSCCCSSSWYCVGYQLDARRE